MYFRQFSDAHATYKELMNALDVAKVDASKKMKIQIFYWRSGGVAKKSKIQYCEWNPTIVQFSRSFLQ